MQQFSQVFVEILSNLASIIKVLGCIITSMGPYLQSNSWAKSFAPNGNFANFVEADDYTRMLEKARHISKESKAIAEKEAKSRYFEKYSEELGIPKCLEAIKDHCCYLSCPFLCERGREEVKGRMNNLKLDIEKIKLVFNDKVNEFFLCLRFVLSRVSEAFDEHGGFYFRKEMHGFAQTASLLRPGKDIIQRSARQSDHGHV